MRKRHGGLGRSLVRRVRAIEQGAKGRALHALHLAGIFHKKTPGGVPGLHADQLAAAEPSAEPVQLTCIDYGSARHQIHTFTDVDQLLACERPDWAQVRWIDVNGLSDQRLIGRLAEAYAIHPLAVEDVLHIPQRPKVELLAQNGQLASRLFVVGMMSRFQDQQVITEQVSLVLGQGLVITFQERPGDVWDPIRQRITQDGTRVRLNDASYLMYALLDAIVDHHFPILEHYGERLENLEYQILDRPDPDVVSQVHAIKRELLLLRRHAWPMREVISALQREPWELISDPTRTYLRDVSDHAVQVMEILETYREVAIGLAETYRSIVAERMNAVMKVLTIIATIFIPITFLAGVYGMNFTYLPEKDWAWAICLIMTVGMLWWFRRKRWL